MSHDAKLSNFNAYTGRSAYVSYNHREYPYRELS